MDQKVDIILFARRDLFSIGIETTINESNEFRLTFSGSFEEYLLDVPTEVDVTTIAIIDSYYFRGGKPDDVLSRLRSGDVRIIAFGAFSEQTLLLARLGVVGFFSKQCTQEELKRILREISKNGMYYDEEFQEKMLSAINSKRSSILLTDREQEFIQLCCDAEEYTYKAIAVMMSLSERTIEKYAERLFEKFGVKTRFGLVLYAVKNKLVTA